MEEKYVTTNGRTLSEFMEFDHVIMVSDDGSISEPSGVHAPEVYWTNGGPIVEPGGWSLMNGYSGQHLYSGPVMHPSEYIGGDLAYDILHEPGLYVAVVVDAIDCEDHDNPDECGCDRNAGWAVARRDIPHADYPHEPGRLYDCAACESQCFCTPGTTECVYSGEHNQRH